MDTETIVAALLHDVVEDTVMTSEDVTREFGAKVLFAEMNALETDEAKVYKALDKLEAVIAHNESDISTWLPLEYELQQTYAAESVKGFPILEEIQRLAVEKTLEKIAEEKAGRNPDDGRREE
mgnify:CR=1 FL=1